VKTKPAGKRWRQACVLGLLFLAFIHSAPAVASAGTPENADEPQETTPARDARLAHTDANAQSTPRAPETVRGYEEPPGHATERAFLFLPRLILFPVRAGLHVATFPVETIAGQLSSAVPFDKVGRRIKNERYFIPLFGVDPRLGINAGFRAATRNPFHHRGTVTYRAAYGGATDQVYAITFRSRDPKMIPYRNGWTYRLTAKYENTCRHPYFGFGNESSRDSLTYYDQERHLFLGALSYAPSDWMRWDLTLSKHGTRIGHATNLKGDERGIEEIFPDEVTSPGPAPGPNKLWGELALTLDRRNNRGRPTAGWMTEIYYGRQKGSGDDTIDFTRYGLEAQLYLPLARSHVVLLRLAGEEVSISGADSTNLGELPYSTGREVLRGYATELPNLGGRSTLRGYMEHRFIDYATLLASAEYRYAFAPMAEICLFMDFGEALPKLTDPASPLRSNFEGMHRSWGGGFRFAAREDFWFRCFVAISDEDVMLTATLESAFDREDRRERR
jgi:hypothetical protein